MGPMCDMCHQLILRKSKVMDKVIKEIQESQWESDTWQDEDIPLDFRPNNSLDKEIGGKKKEKREKRESGERSSNFSLRSTEIGGSVFVGLRTKDHLLDKGYVWVPKTQDFAKDSSEEFGKSRVSSLRSVHGTS